MKRIILVFILSISIFSIFATITPEAAANEKLSYYLQSIPDKQLGYFGFNNRTEIYLAKLEPCFEISSVTAAGLKHSNNNPGYDDVYQADSLKLFPISVNKHYICMLAVDYTRGEWKAVSIGYRDLAWQAEIIRHTWIEHDIRIVRVLPLQRYYFTVREVGYPNCTRIRFVPEESASKSEDYAHLTPLHEAITDMKCYLDTVNQQGATHEK